MSFTFEELVYLKEQFCKDCPIYFFDKSGDLCNLTGCKLYSFFEFLKKNPHLKEQPTLMRKVVNNIIPLRRDTDGKTKS